MLAIKQRILIGYAQCFIEVEIVNADAFLKAIKTVLGSFEIPDTFK